jgi:hypothetical protein
MDPPGRGSISTEEAREVLGRVAALEADLLKIEGFRADLADRCFRQAQLNDAVFDLAAVWRDALTNGRHVALRQRWPELATALDALIDDRSDLGGLTAEDYES